MIPFDFVYIRPGTLQEAAKAYQEEKTPYYYSGGTEIITMSRAGTMRPGTVIDLKEIPECMVLEKTGDKLIIGACHTLNTIKESKLFPLLGTACGRIADHTNQCRITLGGNLCGTIIYRETSLPLLLSDAEVVLFGPEGMRTLPFSSVFMKRMRLNAGEFIVQAQIPVWALQAKYVHIKKAANEKIDYPLINLTALFWEGRLRIAFTGLCDGPFRSEPIEQVFNDQTLSILERIDCIPGILPSPPLTDAQGSGEYRLFVLKNTLTTLLEEWNHGAI